MVESVSSSLDRSTFALDLRFDLELKSLLATPFADDLAGASELFLLTLCFLEEIFAYRCKHIEEFIIHFKCSSVPLFIHEHLGLLNSSYNLFCFVELQGEIFLLDEEVLFHVWLDSVLVVIISVGGGEYFADVGFELVHEHLTHVVHKRALLDRVEQEA